MPGFFAQRGVLGRLQSHSQAPADIPGEGAFSTRSAFLQTMISQKTLDFPAGSFCATKNCIFSFLTPRAIIVVCRLSNDLLPKFVHTDTRALARIPPPPSLHTPPTTPLAGPAPGARAGQGRGRARWSTTDMSLHPEPNPPRKAVSTRRDPEEGRQRCPGLLALAGNEFTCRFFVAFLPPPPPPPSLPLPGSWETRPLH